ncbi:MAG: hypothetical protein CMQ38_05140 [Gammaproteobacteria bacterium]|nr:hypothetical protein [Gammaproteobacteria bacterium]
MLSDYASKLNGRPFQVSRNNLVSAAESMQSKFLKKFLKKIFPCCLTLLFSSSLIPVSYSQQLTVYERLPSEMLAVSPPSNRISGDPGDMQIIDRSCSSLPRADVRRRLVDIAVQEWAYFGMSEMDLTGITENQLAPRDSSGRRRYHRPGFEEASRVADSIAGYWSAAPDSSWILNRQNQNWERNGLGARWRDFWSAAFISWVACESGLGDMNEFSRAIAHHTYIDQAIRARDGMETDAAYIAYDVGEAEVNPGDMLCRASRPEYLNLDQRRPHMGQGARTHCDIVVGVDPEAGEIKAIGGNVRASVRMKVFPAAVNDNAYLVPLPYAGRQIFAHLKLQARAIEEDAINNSPTMLHLESLTSTTIINRSLASNERD